jgi:hypothetical protein
MRARSIPGFDTTRSLMKIPSRAPLVSWRGAAVALALAVVLCWPMLLSGGFYTFPDTGIYLRGGDVIWTFMVDLVGLASTDAPEAAGIGSLAGAAIEEAAADGGQGPVVVRSIAYSAFSFALFSTGGAVLLAIAQAAIAVFTVFAFLGPSSEYRMPVLLSGAVLVTLTTSLPWFSVYIMPDLFAALVILHAALLIRRFDDLTRTQQVVMTAIAVFATASHYGNPPLALGLFACALGWRAITRTWSTAALVGAVVPLLLTPLANLTLNAALLDRPSTAPLRLPILLARSLEDGPARWYLEAACPEADLAVCVLFADGSPDNISVFLWSDRGLKGLPRETVSRIQDEELEVLFQAFLAYPVQQTTSILRNAAAQLPLLGLVDLQLTEALDDKFRTIPPEEPGRDAGAKRLASHAIAASTWGSLAILAFATISGRRRREDIEIIAMLILGLLLNALIFGGLSAPADRYQTRVVWILPVFAVIVMARRRVTDHD